MIIRLLFRNKMMIVSLWRTFLLVCLSRTLDKKDKSLDRSKGTIIISQFIIEMLVIERVRLSPIDRLIMSVVFFLSQVSLILRDLRLSIKVSKNKNKLFIDRI
jgi:hypothetical protein